MTRRDEFELLFQRDPDPWNFRSSPYEAAKFDATIAALGGRRFASGLDVGCANGVLTARLAAQCDRLLAVAVAQAALDLAAEEMARQGHGHVAFRRADIPDDWPTGRFDLIVLSEVLYFIGADEVRRTAAHVAQAALPGATVLSVNTTAPIAKGLSGAETEVILTDALPGWAEPVETRGEGWRILRWTAPG